MVVDSAVPAAVQDLFPSTLHARLNRPEAWKATHMDDPPVAPPQDTREAELAALAAQEKLGHDGKRQRVRARRTVDPFGGLEKWKIVSEARGELLELEGTNNALARQFRTVQTSLDDQLFMRSNPSYLVNVSCWRAAFASRELTSAPFAAAATTRLHQPLLLILLSICSHLDQQDPLSRQHRQGQSRASLSTLSADPSLAVDA